MGSCNPKKTTSKIIKEPKPSTITPEPAEPSLCYFEVEGASFRVDNYLEQTRKARYQSNELFINTNVSACFKSPLELSRQKSFKKRHSDQPTNDE